MRNLIPCDLFKSLKIIRNGILKKSNCTKSFIYGSYCSRRQFQQDSRTSLKDDENHFGFEVVTSEEKRQKVQTVFSNVASKYDLMNDIMSGGVHRLWKDYLIQMLDPTPGTKLLDVACGTGDITFRFLQAANGDSSYIRNRFTPASEQKEDDKQQRSHAVALDVNEDMISICKKRAEITGLDKAITCVLGTAEDLPFQDNTFDAYTIAFGIRNVALIDRALCEAHRVLRPGGRFLCLEFSQVENPLVSWFYDWYSMQIIPCLGQLIAGDWKSYQYLVESIRKFPNKEDFQYKIEDAGFKMTTYTNLFNGIAAIHSGYKL